MKIKVLLVEDDINLGMVISDHLQTNGYAVTIADDGAEGLVKFNSSVFHLCILDVMLPKLDGFSVAKDIRKTNMEVPILFLTAKSMTEDKIMGFDLSHGGHLTHGSPVNFSGKFYQTCFYSVEEATGRINYDTIKETAQREKPQLMICGALTSAACEKMKKQDA